MTLRAISGWTWGSRTPPDHCSIAIMGILHHLLVELLWIHRWDQVCFWRWGCDALNDTIPHSCVHSKVCWPGWVLVCLNDVEPKDQVRKSLSLLCFVMWNLWICLGFQLRWFLCWPCCQYNGVCDLVVAEDVRLETLESVLWYHKRNSRMIIENNRVMKKGLYVAGSIFVQND